MKLRNNFVSNSSSTSFILAVNGSPDSELSKAFLFIINTLCPKNSMSKDDTRFNTTAGDRKKEIQEEIKTSKRDISYIEETITFLESSIKNPTIRECLEKCLDIVDGDNSFVIRHNRGQDHQTRKDRKLISQLDIKIERLKDSGKKLDRHLKRLTEQLELLIEIPDDNVVIGLTTSLHEDLENTINRAINENVVKVIRRETT